MSHYADCHIGWILNHSLSMMLELLVNTIGLLWQPTLCAAGCRRKVFMWKKTRVIPLRSRGHLVARDVAHLSPVMHQDVSDENSSMPRWCFCKEKMVFNMLIPVKMQLWHSKKRPWLPVSRPFLRTWCSARAKEGFKTMVEAVSSLCWCPSWPDTKQKKY